MDIKYRIGVMPGPWPGGADGGADFFWRFVETCEKSAIDSVWFSERLSSPLPVPEPITAMAAIAARTARLKEGVEKTQEFAAAAGREVPVDHFGALFYFCLDDDPSRAQSLALPFVPRNRVDDATLAHCTAFGPPALVRERLEQYVAAGA